MPNWASFSPKGVAFVHISQVRHWPDAAAPATRPITSETPISAQRLNGARPDR